MRLAAATTTAAVLATSYSVSNAIVAAVASEAAAAAAAAVVIAEGETDNLRIVNDVNDKSTAAAGGAGAITAAKSRPNHPPVTKGRSRHRGRRGRGRRGRGRGRRQIQQQQESPVTKKTPCDPSTSTSTLTTSSSNADLVGILASCGFGRYCQETPGGTNGTNTGICMDVRPDQLGDELKEHRLLQEDEDTNSTTTAPVDDGDDDEDGPLTLVEEIALLCNETSAEELLGAGVTCDCNDVNVDDYTGTAYCVYPEECDVDATDACGDPAPLCYVATYRVNIVSANNFETQFCYDYSSPVEMMACYSETVLSITTTDDDENATTAVVVVVDTTQGCEVGVSGTTCNQCAVVQRESDGETCLELDCSNLLQEEDEGIPSNDPFSGEVCMDETDVNSFVDLVLREVLLYNVLPCPDGCNLCGEFGAYMNSTNAIVSLPGSLDEFECGFLQVAALSGGFANIEETDVCNLFLPVVREDCQCLDVNGTLLLPLPSTLAPSAAPVTPTSAPTSLPTSSGTWRKTVANSMSSLAVALFLTTVGCLSVSIE